MNFKQSIVESLVDIANKTENARIENQNLKKKIKKIEKLFLKLHELCENVLFEETECWKWVCEVCYEFKADTNSRRYDFYSSKSAVVHCDKCQRTRCVDHCEDLFKLGEFYSFRPESPTAN